MNEPQLGHNNPPAPTLFEQSSTRIDDLFGEAQLWLDGATVDSQPLADGIGNLLDLIRKAKKFADDSRKVENEPFDRGKAEVQARYNPLLKRADLASEACKSALQPWLDRREAEIRAAAQKARQEAEAKQHAAEAALRAADRANLEERAKAEALVAAAKKAETAANKAERQTATAGGATGRSVGLRTEWIATMTDARAAVTHYWKTERAAIEEFLKTLADGDVRRGKRDIPGFSITEQRKAV